MPGLFISFEGVDGSGKQTQAELLQGAYKAAGIEAIKEGFPRYETITGHLIKDYLTGKFGDPTQINPELIAPLFALDRLAASWLIAAVLERGGVYIADRFTDSNAAHQGSKIADPVERLLFINELFRYEHGKQYEHGELGIPRPDVTIFLSAEPKYTLALSEKRGERDGHEADPEHITNSFATFQSIIEADPERFIVVNTIDEARGEMRSRIDIHREICRELSQISLREVGVTL